MIDERERMNIDVFSTSAEYYSKKENLFPQERVVIERYFRKKGGKVLDLGCGTGRTTYHLYRMGYRVVGVDISEEMVRIARRKYPYIDFYVGDACSLSFKDESFDYVLFSFNGIDYIYPESNRIAALREVYRVLRPGGVFAFSTHNMAYIPERPSGLLHMLATILKNLMRGNLSKYLYSSCDYGELLTYHTTPSSQVRQLRSVGFEVVDIIGRRRGFSRYLEPWLYYVAIKKG